MDIEFKKHKWLYLDSSRKTGFDKLLHAYINTYEGETKIGIELEEKLKKNIYKYTGTVGDDTEWKSLYTLSRELGTYIVNNDEYRLSPIAEDLWNSKISAREYLTNYLLNLNLIIDEKIVHPLHKILSFIIENESRYISADGKTYEVSISDLKDIEDFKFDNVTGDEQKLITQKINKSINNFIRRMESAKIVEIEETRDGKLNVSKPMKIKKDKANELIKYCYIWEDGIDKFLELKDDVYITSKRNKYIYGDEGEI
ncbi:MAG: hypothetical protein E6538_08570 [Paeniclostridium sordellii]|nr:hypothetical protein [Paeniclostridium sordellii]